MQEVEQCMEQLPRGPGRGGFGIKNMNSNEIEVQPSCEDEQNTGLITVAEAQARILEGVAPVTATETLPVREALGRVLAEDIVSPINVPSHTNSAMDGYAVRAEDLPADGVREFPVPGT